MGSVGTGIVLCTNLKTLIDQGKRQFHEILHLRDQILHESYSKRFGNRPTKLRWWFDRGYFEEEGVAALMEKGDEVSGTAKANRSFPFGVEEDREEGQLRPLKGPMKIRSAPWRTSLLLQKPRIIRAFK